MSVTVRYQINRKYFNTLWLDWMRAYRKWWFWFGVLGWFCVVYSILFFASLLYFKEPIGYDYLFVIIGTFIVGGFILFRYYYLDCYVWVRPRLKKITTDVSLSVLVTDKEIIMNENEPEKAYTWDDVREFVEGRYGLLFIAYDEKLIYFPYVAIQGADGSDKIVEFYTNAKKHDFGEMLEKVRALSASGDYEEALALGEDYSEKMKGRYGETHRRYIESLNNLGVLHGEQLNYVEAELLYKQALELGEKHLGAEDDSVAMILTNLAFNYWVQGQTDLALPLYKRLLDIKEKMDGSDHIELVSIIKNMASIYKEQGDEKQANALEARVQKLMK